MSNLPATLQSTISNLEAAQRSTPKDISGDFQFLKMTKAGEWVYGADETEVSENSVFVIDPNSYAQGFVAWDDGELVEEVMAVAGEPAVTRADLPDIGNIPWDTQVAFALKGIEGKEEGVQLLYKVSSRGGRNAVAELLAKIIERGKAGEEAICPVVCLENSSYRHKKYGKIYTPILTVEDWIDLVDTPDPEPAQVAADPEPVKDPDPDPEPEPKRRRRKRSA